jgi:hypothetical protein
MKIHLEESELQQVIDSLDHNGKDAPNELKKQLEERMADYKHDEKKYNEWYKASYPLFNTLYYWKRATPDDLCSKDYIDGSLNAFYEALALTYPFSLGNSNDDRDAVDEVYDEWEEEFKGIKRLPF